MTTPTSDTGQAKSDLAGEAAESADAAIRTARQKANDALEGITDTMHGVKEKAAATLERLRPQLDSVTTYAREEPTKALLIAAAAGAGLMALIALTARSGDRMPSARSLRDKASDTVDEWRKAAADKADEWRRSATDAGDRASSKADSALDAGRNTYEGLSDAMAQWKEQAASLVERVRPQLDSVTGYAKDDPAKALLIAAAAGAALMGLVSAMGR
jgi:ElaB/YqjD/DUF883 family membrane-anchored ribosome-binding protein